MLPERFLRTFKCERWLRYLCKWVSPFEHFNDLKQYKSIWGFFFLSLHSYRGKKIIFFSHSEKKFDFQCKSLTAASFFFNLQRSDNLREFFFRWISSLRLNIITNVDVTHRYEWSIGKFLAIFFFFFLIFF